VPVEFANGTLASQFLAIDRPSGMWPAVLVVPFGGALGDHRLLGARYAGELMRLDWRRSKEEAVDHLWHVAREDGLIHIRHEEGTVMRLRNPRNEHWDNLVKNTRSVTVVFNPGHTIGANPVSAMCDPRALQIEAPFRGTN